MKTDTNTLIFIAVFPPPFGGVTVKDKLFYDAIKKYRKVEVIDIFAAKRNKFLIPFLLLKCVFYFIKGSAIVYGLDTKRLKFFLRIHQYFKKSLKKTTVIAMGGYFPQHIRSSKALQKSLVNVKSIWVETEGMRQQLIQQYFQNIFVFPNPKSGIGACKPRIRKENEALKLVFFSQISEEKGVGDIIEAVNYLNKHKDIVYSLDFYGHISDNIHEKFEEFLIENESVSYKGVFDSTQFNIYQKLNEYDILLFPSHWEGEGVPGILVEAKMAGLAIITSNKNYNCEIVRSNEGEGIVLNGNYTSELVKALIRLYNTPDELIKIKKCSFASRKRYALEEYFSILHTL